MAINREEITDVIFSGTRTPAARLHVARHRRLLRGHPAAPRCSTSTPTRPRSCGPRPTPSRRGTAPSRSPTTPTAATRPGSTLSRTSSRTPSASTRRATPYPTFAEARAPRSPTAPSRPRSAPVGRPTTRPCTTSSDRSTRPDAGSNDGDYSSPEFDDAAQGGSRRDRHRRREREVPGGSGDPLQGPPRHPAVVLQRQRRMERHGRQRAVRLELGSAVLARSPRASNSRSSATRG